MSRLLVVRGRLLWAAAALWASHATAGRPLSVDDANVNERGAGHLETWYARALGGGRVWTVAPAYAPWDGVELSGAWARDVRSAISTTSVQAKFRLSESRPNACHPGAVIGAAHVGDSRGNTRYANLLLTCNQTDGALHLNLGASRPPGGPTLPTFGLAYEQDLGAMTGHVEVLGQRQSKPTVGLGLRKEVVKDVQIDGSLGRSNRETLFSLGFKLQF